MLPLHWLASLRRNEGRSTVKARGARRRKPALRRSAAEFLERRVLLTNYVDQLADFALQTDANENQVIDDGDTVTWRPGTALEVQDLVFGEDAFDSIQDAVDDAFFGETVFVAPGTFEETVDINRDLTLSGALLPTESRTDVLIDPQGAASNVVTVQGGIEGAQTVTIENLTVRNTGNTDPNRRGIFADHVSNRLTIDNVLVEGHTGTGIDVEGSGSGDGSGNGSGVGPGDVFLDNVASNDNGTDAEPGGGDGIELTGVGNVDVQNTTAGGNGGIGIHVVDSGDVTITGSTFDGNGVADQAGNGDGIEVSNVGNVDVQGTSASGNGETGFQIFEGAENVAIAASTFDGNGLSGLFFENIADLAVQQTTASGNGSDGLSVSDAGDVAVTDSTFDGNGGDGVDLSSVGNVAVRQTSGTGNGSDGLQISSAGDVAVRDSTFDGNGSDGLDVASVGNVAVRQTSGTGNGSDGLQISSAGDVAVSTATFDGNGSDGLDVASVGDVAVQQTSGSGNGSDGLQITSAGNVAVSTATFDGNGSDGLDVANVGDVAVQQTSGTGNGSDGLAVFNAGDSVVSDSTFDGNGFDGVALRNLFGPVVLTGVVADGNDDDGLDVEDVDPGFSVFEFDDFEDAPPALSVIDSAFRDNGDRGITAAGIGFGADPQSGSGTIGNVLFEHATATGNGGVDVVVDRATGSILGGRDREGFGSGSGSSSGSGSTDLIAGSALLVADGSIGLPEFLQGDEIGNGPLDTQIDNLEASAGQAVHVLNDGALTIGNVDGLDGVSAVDTVRIGTTLSGHTGGTDNSLTVAETVASQSTVWLRTDDFADATSNVTVEGSATVTSAFEVLVRAGDDVTLQAGSAVTAPSGRVFLVGDDGNADPGVGARIELLGTVSSRDRIHVEGNDDGDRVELGGSSVATGGEQYAVLVTTWDGNDRVDASTGTFGGAGVAVDGGRGDDVVRGSNDDDVLAGGLDDDILIGGLGDDCLLGGTHGGRFESQFDPENVDGNDVLQGDVPPTLNDSGRFILTSPTGGVVTTLAANFLDATSPVRPDDPYLFSNVGPAAGTGSDTLYGDAGNDHLNGGLGGDTVVGGAGDDRILAGEPLIDYLGRPTSEWSADASLNDRLFGGMDDDVIVGDLNSDVVGREQTSVSGSPRIEIHSGGSDFFDATLASNGTLLWNANFDQATTSVLSPGFVADLFEECGSVFRTALLSADHTLVSLSYVREATPLDANGEVADVPASADWLSEWDGHWVEVWVHTNQGQGVSAADVALDYDGTAYTATEVVFADAFDTARTSAIDDASGTVSLVASSSRAGLGTEGHVLLARVRMESLENDGLAVDASNPLAVAPVDVGPVVESAEVTFDDGSSETAVGGANPATEFRPVVWDLDDSGAIDFADVSRFVTAFGSTVHTSASPHAWRLDTDRDGRIDFADFTAMAGNFGRQRGGTGGVAFPEAFDRGWYGETVSGAVTDDVDVLLDAAVQAWRDELGTAFDPRIQLVVRDLGADRLGEAEILALDETGRPAGGRITIDDDAAGLGWYASIDATPFGTRTGTDSFAAGSRSAAAGRYDLFTVLLHEVGHVAGFTASYAPFGDQLVDAGGSSEFVIGGTVVATLAADGLHLDATAHPGDVMNATLSPGERRLPSELDALLLEAAYAAANRDVAVPVGSAPLTAAPPIGDDAALVADVATGPSGTAPETGSAPVTAGDSPIAWPFATAQDSAIEDDRGAAAEVRRTSAREATALDLVSAGDVAETGSATPVATESEEVDSTYGAGGEARSLIALDEVFGEWSGPLE